MKLELNKLTRRCQACSKFPFRSFSITDAETSTPMSVVGYSAFLFLSLLHFLLFSYCIFFFNFLWGGVLGGRWPFPTVVFLCNGRIDIIELNFVEVTE